MKIDSIPTARPRMRLILLAVSVLILVLGAVENLYGNTDDGDVYGSDAVQYLDIARAIERHDWRSALNPLWSQGYPALLAAERPLFAAGPGGDWAAIRVLNFSIFAANYAAFLYFLVTILPGIVGSTPAHERRKTLLWIAGLTFFVATQICLGQVSRVNPDELVTTLFFLFCGLAARCWRWTVALAQRRGSVRWGLSMGLVLGVGFLVKAIFLPLGCGMLALLALRWRRHWRSVRVPLFAAAAVFASIVAVYGIALSSAVGHRTLGESGAINYAWHVNRLQKWVHWEGGRQPANIAWPKTSMARFARWDDDPPEFGAPLHPSAILQESPRVYGFTAPIHATYVPYYDPPYWYEGYRHLIRPRYQLIALVKCISDLALVLLRMPLFFAFLLALGLLLRDAQARALLRIYVGNVSWALWFGLLGVAIYLPVHLEGRYLAGFLALIALQLFAGATLKVEMMTTGRVRAVSGLLLIGLAGNLLLTQAPVWRNLLHHKSPRNNVEWKIGEAVVAQGLPPMSQVGVLGWTANLHSDWAYIAHLQITSEIASPADIDLFWRQTPAEQARTLETFRKAGAVAVFTRGKPASAGPEWTPLGDTGMSMLRLADAQVR
ncbi:4-amino-4-deoxy-L-arabinose transferase [Granulicella rosea]|uniref:4-amino-4-deoxy-L-arabinose transferase n=1 Tax=Granulicella rosea TaxID=474952 RepID=A0A239DPW3_9BACT|nr:hypothetical protein [Granulicella rosea]SNS33783.1 4-amino-4-deoxy-L-arabinose transferase [Granulicella rosea]